MLACSPEQQLEEKEKEARAAREKENAEPQREYANSTQKAPAGMTEQDSGVLNLVFRYLLGHFNVHTGG